MAQDATGLGLFSTWWVVEQARGDGEVALLLFKASCCWFQDSVHATTPTPSRRTTLTSTKHMRQLPATDSRW